MSVDPVIQSTTVGSYPIPAWLVAAPSEQALLDATRVVIATQCASMLLAFILAVLTMTHRIGVKEIIALATLLGVVNAFDVPARQSFLTARPNVERQEHLCDSRRRAQ